MGKNHPKMNLRTGSKYQSILLKRYTCLCKTILQDVGIACRCTFTRNFQDGLKAYRMSW